MEVYLINMILVVVSGFLGSTIVKDKVIDGVIKYNWFFLIVALVSLSLVSGFRYYVGTDYGNYVEIYTYFGMQPIEVFIAEAGFEILYRCLYRITTNPQILFFITSIAINVCMIVFLKRHSKNITLSLYFYITMGIYYSTMNGWRQYLASMIIALGFRHIIKPNLKKFLIYVLIGSLFHSTAFVMIPIYFICTKQICSLENKIFIGIISGAFIFYQPFVNIMVIFLGDSKYSSYADDFINSTNGANIIRIIVWILPVAIALIFRKNGRDLYKDYYDKVVNMSMYGMCFMILAYRQVFFARFTMYFDIYYALLLAMLPRVFDKKFARVFTYILVVSYFAYSTILLLSGEENIYPYKYNLSLF